jgi:hypothetical protein
MIRILMETLRKGTRNEKNRQQPHLIQERRLLLPDGDQGILAAINGVVEYVRGLPIDRRISPSRSTATASNGN